MIDRQAQPLSIPRDEIDDLLPLLAEQLKVIMLVGPRGTGKSTMAEDTAAQLGVPAYRFNSHPYAERGEFEGGYAPIKGIWDFQPGPALMAYEDGLLIINDAHLAGPGQIAPMYTALDIGAGGKVTLPGKVTITQHSKYAVIITMNGFVESLDPGVEDRLMVTIPVYKPSTKMLDLLGPPGSVVRETCQADYSGVSDTYASFREYLSWSKMWPLVGLHKALLFALKANEERTAKMVEHLAKGGKVPEAIQVWNKLCSTKPDGAP